MFILISEQETHRGTRIIIDHSGRRRKQTFEFGLWRRSANLVWAEKKNKCGESAKEKKIGGSLPSEFE